MKSDDAPRVRGKSENALNEGAAIRERARETCAVSRNLRWVVVLHRTLRQKIAERRKPTA